MCHYAYNGFARHSVDYEVVERTDLSWVNLTEAVKPKIVGTAGWGICAVQVSGAWRAGHLNHNNACYTAGTSGNQYTRTPFYVGMKVLIKD